MQLLHRTGKVQLIDASHCYEARRKSIGTKRNDITDQCRDLIVKAYSICFKIAKDTPENPELPESRATKIIKKYEKLHPYNISQKSQIIVETFRETTKNKIGGKGKMMVVTDSRLAAVRYFHEIKRYIQERHYADMDILAAFSGSVQDGDEEYTESGLNVRKDGSHISEGQTKEEFHDKYDAVMSALAGVIYREMRSKKTVDYRKVERDEQVQMVAEEPVKYGK